MFLRSALLILLLQLCALVGAACGSPSKEFTFENSTDQAVTIRVNDRLRLLLQPGETKSFGTPNNKGNRHVIAVDSEGVVRMDKVFSWQELEQANFYLQVE